MAEFPSKQIAPAQTARRARAAGALPGYALALAAALALALALRLPGLGFGLPYLEHPDEWAVAEDALRMLRTGDWSPFSFTYPTLYTYLQVGVAAAHFWWGAALGLYRAPADIDPARYYAWARALTALLGTGAVLLTYLLGRRAYGREAGLLAATLLAVMPAVAGDSHYVTVDTPAMFFTLAGLCAIAWLALPARAHGDAPRAPDGPRSTTLRALLAGVCCGLAVATKYNTGVLVVPLAFAAVSAAARASGRPTARSLLAALVALLGMALGFTLGTPLWLAELPRLLADLASIAEHYRVTGHPGAESSRPALWYWGAIQSEGWLLAWAMLGGALLALARRSRGDLLLLAFIVPYYAQLSSVKVVFFRNAMPMLPALCLLAAAAVVAAVGAVGARRAAPVRQHAAPVGQRAAPERRPSRLRALLLALALLALAAQPLAKAARDEWLRAQPTTRVLATEWVLANAPDGARIWLEDQTLILPPRLRVAGGRPITEHDPAWYREGGFRFLVANESIAKSDPALLAAFGEPVARFAADGERHGHTFAIYATGAGDAASEPRTPSGATLGGGALTLDGYRHPGAARAGDVLPLALYWQVNRALPADYTVFVHLLDEAGGKVAQRDTPPLDGALPTSAWQPGALIRDDQDLPIPAGTPAGRYRLVVGMYDAATLTPITDAGPIDLGEVEIR